MSLASLRIDLQPLREYSSIDLHKWITLIRDENPQLHHLLEQIQRSLPATANEYGRKLAAAMYKTLRQTLDSDDGVPCIDVAVVAQLLGNWRTADRTVNEWKQQLLGENEQLHTMLRDIINELPDDCRGYAMEPPLAIYVAFSLQQQTQQAP